MKYLLSLLQEALKITVEKHKMGDLFIQLDGEKVSKMCLCKKNTVSIIKAVIAIYGAVMVYETMIIIFLKVIFFIYIYLSLRLIFYVTLLPVFQQLTQNSI